MSARLLRRLVPGKLDERRLSPEARAELIVWRDEMAGVKVLDPGWARRCVVVPIYEPMGFQVDVQPWIF